MESSKKPREIKPKNKPKKNFLKQCPIKDVFDLDEKTRKRLCEEYRPDTELTEKKGKEFRCGNRFCGEILIFSPSEIEKGDLECWHCGSKKIISTQEEENSPL